MWLDNTRAFTAIVVVGIAAMAGCRSRATGSDTLDSAQPSARTDSSPSSAGAGGTVRTDSVVLRTDKTQYRAGERMTLTFENKSAARGE